MNGFNILDYGACEGKLCTKEIQAAFDAACKRHGTVIVPAGTYLTGTLNMRGSSLFLEKGARLLGSEKIEDYSDCGYAHNEMGKTLSLLYSMNSEDVLISGEGVIDLSGDAFYDLNDFYIPKSRIPYTEEQIRECTTRHKGRPSQPIFFYNCVHVTVKDIRIVNSPCWTVTFVECSDVRVTDLTIDNNLSLPNSDGMHFCSCNNVLVRGCNISSGDDCVALSSITDWNKPCERVTISDCVFRSCSKAFSIGYMHSIVRDVTISNCVVYESNRAMSFMSCAGTGLVENVVVSNLRLDTRVRAGDWWGNGEPVCVMGTYHTLNYRDKVPENRFPVNIRNILFQNLICSGENAIAVVGENGSVQNIRFENLSFELKDSANLPLKGRTVDLSPGEWTAVMPDNETPYWLFLKQVDGVTVKNAVVKPFHGAQPKALCDSCENVVI